MNAIQKRSESNSPAQFPLVDLLPSVPSGALSSQHLQVLSARLDDAKRAAGNGPELSAEEAHFFSQNCDVLRRVGMGLALRNYALLEIYEARQWRSHYQSVEDFAKAVAQISKSQLMKCIDSARIAIELHDAGMDDVAPHGRQIEMLAMVPVGFRVQAWHHALEVIKVDGQSMEIVKSALRDFCRDRHLQFGRRKPNGSKNIGLSSSFLLPPATSVAIEQTRREDACEEPTIDVSEEDEQFLLHLLPRSLVGEARRTFRRKPVGRVVADIAVGIAGDPVKGSFAGLAKPRRSIDSAVRS